MHSTSAVLLSRSTLPFPHVCPVKCLVPSIRLASSSRRMTCGLLSVLNDDTTQATRRVCSSACSWSLCSLSLPSVPVLDHWAPNCLRPVTKIVSLPPFLPLGECCKYPWRYLARPSLSTLPPLSPSPAFRFERRWSSCCCGLVSHNSKTHFITVRVLSLKLFRSAQSIVSALITHKGHLRSITRQRSCSSSTARYDNYHFQW